MAAIEAKWRPTLSMITAAVIAAALLLPLIGLVFFRLYENQLIRQTESELIAQAAMLSAVYAREIEEAPPGAFPIGRRRPPLDPARSVDERYAPITATLDLASSPILRARPDAAQAAHPIGPDLIRVGEKLKRVTEETQITTLAGFRLLDAEGRIVLGGADVGRSFVGQEEVQQALGGQFSAMMRTRNEDEPPPPLYSISRGTRIRIFVAMPVFVDDRLRGVVYVSRTPDHILRNLYAERARLTLAAALILITAAAIGAVFVRTVARPVADLARRAEAITQGDRTAIGPLNRHGTEELARLTESFMTMAKRLSDRSDYLSTFASHVTHELKTPLTAIKGAAELMLDADAMAPEVRRRFVENILADAERMTALLERLRELGRADNPALGGATTLDEVAADLRRRFEGVHVGVVSEAETPIAMSLENALIVFGNLLDNARHHGATRVDLVARPSPERLIVLVRDDGAGVSPGNRDKIFDPFFTTRRAEGGAGMGLGIVRALLRAHGGDIRLEQSEQGATFAVLFARNPSLAEQASWWKEFGQSIARLFDTRAPEI